MACTSSTGNQQLLAAHNIVEIINFALKHSQIYDWEKICIIDECYTRKIFLIYSLLDCFEWK